MRELLDPTMNNFGFKSNSNTTNEARHSGLVMSMATHSKGKRSLLPVGSNIYELGSSVLYMNEIEPSDRFDLADHIFIPENKIRTLYYVYLEDPSPCLVPLYFKGTVEKRLKSREVRFDEKGWVIGCSLCLKRKSLCDSCAEYYPPPPPLVGIETNPGPQNSPMSLEEALLDPNLTQMMFCSFSYEFEEEQRIVCERVVSALVVSANVPAVGNEIPGLYMTVLTKDDFFKVHNSCCEVHFSLIPQALAVVLEGTLANMRVCDLYQYVPPAPFLVGVEENPGPDEILDLETLEDFPYVFDSIMAFLLESDNNISDDDYLESSVCALDFDVLDDILSFFPQPSPPSFIENKGWGDEDYNLDLLEEYSKEIESYNESVDSIVLSVDSPKYEAFMFKGFVDRIVGDDPIGTGKASDAVKEAATIVADSFKASLDSITEDGAIKHVHSLPSEVIDLLKKLSEAVSGFAVPSASDFIRKLSSVLPGMDGLSQLFSEGIDPKVKQILCSVAVATIGAVAAKYELDWKVKLLVCAVQWGIVLSSDSSELRMMLYAMHGVEVATHIALAVLPLVQSWILSPEADYSAHAIPIMESISFQTRHIIPVFAKFVITYVSFGKFDGNLDTFMSSCKLYKQLMNGYDFTITSMVDLVRRIIEILGSPFGFQMFRESYSDFPDIYKVMDCFSDIQDKISSAKKLYSSDLTAFRISSRCLLALEKAVGPKGDNAVYHSQIRVLRMTHNELQKALACFGLKNNSYRLRPAVITLFGPSAIGKTPLMRVIMNALAPFIVGEDQVDDFLENSDSYIHFWAECEFHDNMQPETKILGYDDFMQTRKASTAELCPMRQLISMVNNVAAPINCSESKLKNTRFHEEELMVLSTNRAKFDVNDVWIYQIEAGLNRLGLCVQICIKETFIKKDGPEIDKNWGYTLDKTKVDRNKLNLNVYDFLIKNVFDDTVIEAFDNFKDFMIYVLRYYLAHQESEVFRMNEMLHSMNDPDLNPLVCITRADFDVSLRDKDGLMEYKPHMEEEGLRRFLQEKMAEYRAQEQHADEEFDAANERYRGMFGYRMSTPRDPYWYVSMIDGLWWTKIYSQDPGWADFMTEHMKDLYMWMDGTIEEKIFKSSLWKQASPTEIPHDFKVICRLMRIYYIRVRIATHRYGLAFIDVFNAFRKFDVKTAMGLSNETIRDLCYMEVKDNLKTLSDTWQGVFNFCGAWTRQMLILLPGVVASAFVVDTLVARSGARLRGVRLRTKKPPVVVVHPAPDVTEIPYAPHAMDLNKMALQAARSIHQHNEYGIFVKDEKDEWMWIQSLTFIAGRMALGTTHLEKAIRALERKDDAFTFYLYSYSRDVFTAVLSRYVRIDASGITDRSLYVFHRLSNVHSHQNIVKYMVDVDVKLPAGANLLVSITRVNMINGKPKVERILVARPIRDISMAAYPGISGDQYEYKAYTIDLTTQEGDCGGIAFVSDTRYASTWHMVGMLTAGKKGLWSACSPISRQWAEHMIKNCEEYHGPLLKDDLEINPYVSCSALPPQFLVSYIGEPVSQTQSTAYKRTKMFGLFSEVKKYPAMQMPFDYEDGPEIDPMYLARDKYCKSTGAYNPYLMLQAIMMYLLTLLPVLYDTDHVSPQQFSVEEVTVGNGYVDSTPRNTSVGYEYQVKGITKKMLFGTAPEYDISNQYCQDLFSSVRDNMERGDLGEVIRHPAKDFGKDETLPEKKVLLGKLRLVSGIGVDDLTEEKCRTGYAVAVVSEKPIFSGTAVGLNPCSADWDVFYHYFDGYDIIAGDVKNWDGAAFVSIAYMVLYAVYSAIMYNLSRKASLGLLAFITAMSTSLHAAVFSGIVVVYWWFSGLASGRFSTLVGNSIYDCVLLRYAYLMCYLKTKGVHHLAFKEGDVLNLRELESNIRTVTLGDDHVFGIKKGLDHIDHQRMTWAFSELGITYTSDTKGSEDVKPLRTMDEVTFEQRRWFFCKELGRMVAPLNEDSLFNSLYWSSCNEANIGDVVQSVVDEFSFHGPSRFAEVVPGIVSAYTKYYGGSIERSDYKSCLYFISQSEVKYI